METFKEAALVLGVLTLLGLASVGALLLFISTTTAWSFIGSAIALAYAMGSFAVFASRKEAQ